MACTLLHPSDGLAFPFSTPFQAPSGPIDARKVALSAFYHLLSCRAARVSSTSMHWTALPAPHKAVAARVRRSCATVSRRKPCRPWRSTCHAGLGRARSDEASQRNQASLGMVSESSRAARSQPASRARGGAKRKAPWCHRSKIRPPARPAALPGAPRRSRRHAGALQRPKYPWRRSAGWACHPRWLWPLQGSHRVA